MKEAVTIFKQNRASIEVFLRASVQDFHIELIDETRLKSLSSALPFLELLYCVDEHFVQLTPYYYRDRTDGAMIGSTKQYLFSKVKIESDDLFISNPYISSHTGNACVTVVKPMANGYMIFDFSLMALLKQLKLIEINRPFSELTRYLYALSGFLLLFFSVVLVLYAAYDFFILEIGQGGLKEIGALFKPIIALTLGLAIFDLGKTILEQEVFYKSYVVEEHAENRVLTKFLISIIIALSIEALMVVFKIALSDYSDMIHALYLISGVALLIIALGIFHYFSKKCKDCSLTGGR